MKDSVFGHTFINVRKQRDIKLVTTDKRRNQLVSEPNYHATKWFSEKLLATETLMYEFWYNYMKPKYGDNVNYVIWILIVL